MKSTNNLETELIEKGTTKDKVNTLSLLTIRDNNFNALNQLLELCSTLRAETAFYVLSNITEIMIEFEEKQIEIENNVFRRIKKTYEQLSNNMFIKRKVCDLVYKLIKTTKIGKEFVYIFINKIGCKVLYKIIVKKIVKLYAKNRTEIDKELSILFYRDDKFWNKIMGIYNSIIIKEDDNLKKNRGDRRNSDFNRNVGRMGVDVFNSTTDPKILKICLNIIVKTGQKGASIHKLVKCIENRINPLYALALLKNEDEGLYLNFMEVFIYEIPFVKFDTKLFFKTVDDRNANSLLNVCLHMDDNFVLKCIKKFKKGFQIEILKKHFNNEIRRIIKE